jgi:Cleft lip and palate transmembrane protein 1 (CLPTM1)
MIKLIVQGALVYLLITSLLKKSSDVIEVAVDEGDVASVDPETGKPAESTQRVQATASRNAWRLGQPFDVRVYLSRESVPLRGDVLLANSTNDSNVQLAWHKEQLSYGDWSQEVETRVDVALDEWLRSNGTLFAHVFCCKAKAPWPASASRVSVCLQSISAVIEYRSPVKVSAKKSLLDGAEDDIGVEATTNDGDDVVADERWVPFFKPNVSVAMVVDQTVYSVSSLPAQLRATMHFTKRGMYVPVVYVNDFWLMSDEYVSVNASTPSPLSLSVSFAPISMMRWQMYSQLDQSFRTQADFMGTKSSELDEVKRMLKETNPWLLGLTMAVSLLHMVFDMLAFKNDISYWRDRKTTEGLSVRSIFLNTGSQVVIFLYLLDNDTSWMVVASAGVGCLIEMWKIKKVCNVTRISSFPFVRFDEKMSSSATRRHDETAMRYLSYVLYPLVIGYGVYTLLYEEHKGWYSWLLSTLTGAVYTFGFIAMTPQLFLNYKLKSVKHLPWRVFTYKALNTFIDDLFAFIIKMPALHRIACLRDDIIFFAYLYQRWIYRHNLQRPSEFDPPERWEAYNRQQALLEDSEKDSKSSDDSRKEGKKLK